jgi:hypothetical protein
MTKKEKLEKCLKKEVDNWSSKSFDVLIDELKQPITYVSDCEEIKIQTKIYLLEAEKDYIHVAINVDDMGWRSFVPLGCDFIIHKDGRVDK